MSLLPLAFPLHATQEQDTEQKAFGCSQGGALMFSAVLALALLPAGEGSVLFLQGCHIPDHGKIHHVSRQTSAPPAAFQKRFTTHTALNVHQVMTLERERDFFKIMVMPQCRALCLILEKVV